MCVIGGGVCPISLKFQLWNSESSLEQKSEMRNCKTGKAFTVALKSI